MDKQKLNGKTWTSFDWSESLRRIDLSKHTSFEKIGNGYYRCWNPKSTSEGALNIVLGRKCLGNPVRFLPFQGGFVVCQS